MGKDNVLKVKGKIVKEHAPGNYTVYVEEFESEIKVTASGKSRMIYFKELVIGGVILIDVNPIDKTRGRVARRALDFWTYEYERKKNRKE